jgi:hypothetical protein
MYCRKLNSYALQLYMYKSILESKYDMTIDKKVYLVQLHENLDNFKCVEVPDLTEEIKLLRDLRRQEFSSGM